MSNRCSVETHTAGTGPRYSQRGTGCTFCS